MVNYSDYLFWRQQGLRALTAYLMAKHGLFYVLEYMGEL